MKTAVNGAFRVLNPQTVYLRPASTAAAGAADAVSNDTTHKSSLPRAWGAPGRAGAGGVSTHAGGRRPDGLWRALGAGKGVVHQPASLRARAFARASLSRWTSASSGPPWVCFTAASTSGQFQRAARPSR